MLCMCTGLVWWCSYVFRWVAVFCVAVLSARERESWVGGGWRVCRVNVVGVLSQERTARVKRALAWCDKGCIAGVKHTRFVFLATGQGWWFGY